MHSNLYVKNLPLDLDEAGLRQLFASYGTIESCRIVKNTRTSASKGYGFIKFSDIEQATAAIAGMNGHFIGSGPALEVKLADADAGPPLSSTGQVPSDNLFVRNLPATWGDEDLRAAFSAFGSVIECRVLHSGGSSRGAGALVRMQTAEEAARAIEGMHNRTPSGGQMALLVRYADSPDEKARKLAKKERHGRFAGRGRDSRGHVVAGAPPSSDLLPPGFTSFNSAGIPDLGLQQRQQKHQVGGRPIPLAGQLQAGMPAPMPVQPETPPYESATTSAHSSVTGAAQGVPQLQGNGYQHHHPAAAAAAAGSGANTPRRRRQPSAAAAQFEHPAQVSAAAGVPAMAAGQYYAAAPAPGQMLSAPGGTASLYVKNLPPEADKLYLYERFAPLGAVLSVKVLMDEATGSHCRGVGFVNYSDGGAAIRAIHTLHGAKVGDKFLHVSLQTHRTAVRTN